MNRLDLEIILWQIELGLDANQVAKNMGMDEAEIVKLFSKEA